MKKILLATTVLAMSAGYASADIAWGGSARAGIAANGGGDIETYSSANLAVTMSGATDSGLTFGATFDMTTGRTHDMDADAEDDFGDEDGAMGMPSIFVEGSFGKLTISDDNFDFYDDATSGGDVEYTGSFGSVSVGLISDIDSGEYSAKIGFTSGAISVSADTDTTGQSNLEVGYAMGAVTLSAGTNQDSESWAKVAYSANGISASAKVTSDSADGIDLAAGYSANGLSIDVSTNTEANDWEVTGSYDLGGGLSIEAGTNYTEDMYVGASMSF